VFEPEDDRFTNRKNYQDEEPGYNKSSLEIYLSQIGRNRPLPPNEELQLARRRMNGDESAVDKLVEHNLLFVAKYSMDIGFRFRLPEEIIMELIQEGNIALHKQAKRFDDRGNKLISYANYAIYRAVQQYLRENKYPFHVPQNVHSDSANLSEAFHYLEGSDNRTEESEELTGLSGTRIKNVKKVRAFKEFAPDHIGGFAGNDGITYRPDLLVEQIQLLDDIRQVTSEFRGLIPIEMDVIEKHIISERPMSEIGREDYEGKSREWMRQLKKRGLEKMRESERVRQILSPHL
jgi:RNA polymerase primary sigma factor